MSLNTKALFDHACGVQCSSSARTLRISLAALTLWLPLNSLLYVAVLTLTSPSDTILLPLFPSSPFPPPSPPPIAVIYQLLLHRRLPIDPNGIYALLSSSGIKQTMGMGGFCTSFCGWHSVASYLKGALSLKYLYVGWTADCEGCQRSYARWVIASKRAHVPACIHAYVFAFCMCSCERLHTAMCVSMNVTHVSTTSPSCLPLTPVHL